MSFIHELRRRNVIRMAGLYLVGAWLIVQVTGTVSPMLGAPEWVGRTVLALLAIGFVPALVFSWLYELTPEGFKRDAEVGPGESIAATTGQRMDRLMLAGIVALIFAIAADRYWPRTAPPATSASTTASTEASTATPSEDAGTPTAAPQAPDINPNSIAVLPFVNMSADEDNEYFSDGLAEELLNVLARVEGLGVASRTSSFAYKGREMSASAIGAELRVAHVLEGSVRKSGERVRITAQLIDTAQDRHLWSETFDRELRDIFAIQEEIANAIVEALRGTLGEEASSMQVSVQADTENLNAYELYLRARELLLTRTEFRQWVPLFERVVNLDPAFARGWEGLALASALEVDWGNYDDDQERALLARSAEAAERALALDPSLSMPWAARALVARDGDVPDHAAALEMLERAIAADPQNATAHIIRGSTLASLGFFDRAIESFDRCLEIDPAYGNCLRHKAQATLLLGRTDEALSLLEQGVVSGFNANLYFNFYEPLIRRGNRLAATLMMRERDTPLELQQALLALIEEGKAPGDVAATIRRNRFEAEQYFWALLLRDYALAAEAPNLGGNVVAHWSPAYVGLRASPAFKRLLERQNVPAYWRAHGFPPQCRPLGEADFECDEPSASR